MPNNFLIYKSNKPKINETDFEVVERKGIGHPDNLCDSIAEKISINYSSYCLNKYGVILRHMVDKVAVLGGSSKVAFGHGEMTKPIRLLLNGRFTHQFGDQKIDYIKIANQTIENHFKNVFPLLDVQKWLTIIDNTHFSQGPGVVYDQNGVTKNERSTFFQVPDKKFTKYHNNGFRSNDTSTSVSYFPLSDLEQIVILAETTLNSTKFKQKHPYVGTDIKVMGKRIKKQIELTMCIPFIANYTPEQNFYLKKLNYLKKYLKNLINQNFTDYEIKLFFNTRDDFKKQDIYLTAIGSAVESGDEGAVGRGNRANGVIPFTRNMSSEAPCGKNPVYHVGKIYTAIGNKISEQIYREIGIENTVYLTSQMGRNMTDPWQIAIALDGFHEKISQQIIKKMTQIARSNIENHEKVTKEIINSKTKVY